MYIADMQIFANDKERMDYRATFTKCPDCGGANFEYRIIFNAGLQAEQLRVLEEVKRL